MTSISSLSGGGSSSSTFNGKITGLASGMDTESIIAAMTAATLSKINGYDQKQTVVNWQMEAYREVTSALLDFKDSFSSVTSSSNLSSSSAFSKKIVELLGDNSKYLDVSGDMSSMEDFTIESVDQLAQNGTLTGSAGINDGAITTGDIEFDSKTVCNLANENITFKYDGKEYDVVLTGTYLDTDGNKQVVETYEDLELALEQAMAEIELTDDSGKTLADVIQIEGAYNSETDEINFKLTNRGSGDLSVTMCSYDLREVLGMGGYTDGFINTNLATGESVTGKDTINEDNISSVQDAAYLLTGATLTFNYNGKEYDIVIEDYSVFEGEYDADGNLVDGVYNYTLEMFADGLQNQIDKTIGSNRINVEALMDGNTGSLQFTTMNQDGTVDTSASLSLTGDMALFGSTGALNVDYGATNEFDMDSPLSETNPELFEKLMGTLFNTGHLSSTTIDSRNGTEKALIEIVLVEVDFDNGIFLSDGAEFSWEAMDERLAQLSMNDILDAFNKESYETGYTVSYNQYTNSLAMESTLEGAAGDFIPDNGTVWGTIGYDNHGQGSSGVVFELLFGKMDDCNIQEGQDALMTVNYGNGSGSVQVSNVSNDFTFGSLNVTVKAEFEGDVQISGSTDSENITESVQALVDAYNEMIDLIYGMTSKKPDSEFFALTDDMKADMTETEIERWETEAKKGILYGDSTLSNLATELRSIFYEDHGFSSLWADIGITVSDDWTENGKLSFDASAFEAALAKDPDLIADMFTSEGNGLMSRFDTVIDKYAATTGSTKGILIDLAGHESSPLSLLDNSLLTKYNQYSDLIEYYENKLSNEEERYNARFTALEMYISQMSAQSSWLYEQFS